MRATGITTLERGIKMKRLNIAAVGLMIMAVGAAPAMAQGTMGGGRMDPAQMMQRSTDMMMQGITLSPVQADSVKAINARFATETQAAMGTDDMRAKMTEMRTKHRTELRALLNPDQQSIFDKNVSTMGSGRMGRPRP